MQMIQKFNDLKINKNLILRSQENINFAPDVTIRRRFMK